MSVWYKSFSLDGVYRQIFDGDPFKTFDSPQELKEALDRWAVWHQMEGETFAICKETYEKTFDDSGRIARIESIVEVVEYYTTAKGEAEMLNGQPSQNELEKLRVLYPAGTRVELVKMDDPQAPPVGTKGSVDFVDSIGTIHVSWDNGCGLGVAYGEDECRRV